MIMMYIDKRLFEIINAICMAIGKAFKSSIQVQRFFEDRKQNSNIDRAHTCKEKHNKTYLPSYLCFCAYDFHLLTKLYTTSWLCPNSKDNGIGCVQYNYQHRISSQPGANNKLKNFNFHSKLFSCNSAK